MSTISPLTPEETTARFWSAFYAKNGFRAPSPFVLWCLEEQLAAGSRILELGCGNGRDSFAFLESGLSVLAVDGCAEVIAANRALCPSPVSRHPEPAAPGLDFFLGEFAHLDFRTLHDLPRIAPRWFKSDYTVTTVYSRFVLHAVPETVENGILDFCEEHLPAGCRMLHEFRTIRDPLMQKGVALSSNERLTDHYRRFLDPDAFRAKLTRRGWREKYFIESDGLAVFGDDNPVVARIVVER